MCIRRLKSNAQFLFPKLEGYYIKVLYHITDICGVKYIHMVTYAKAALFLKKKQVFLKSTIFSILIVNQLLTKLSKNKLKIKLQWLHFRFLADIGHCFTFFFFFFAWERNLQYALDYRCHRICQHNF